MTLSPEIRANIVDLRKEGYIDSAIVRMLGVSQPSVAKICKDAGVPRPEREKQLGRRAKYYYSKEQQREIVSLRLQGYVIRAIAEAMDIDENCVKYACDNAGITGVIGHLGRKSQVSPLHDRNEKIRELRGQGLTLQQLGDQYGITRERVRQLCVGIEKPDLRTRKNCGTCGVEFVGRGCSKYCSNECGLAATGRANRTPESKWSRHGKVKLTCAGCKCQFERVRYLDSIGAESRRARGVTDSGLRFCTQQCYWDHCGELDAQLRSR